MWPEPKDIGGQPESGRGGQPRRATREDGHLILAAVRSRGREEDGTVSNTCFIWILGYSHPGPSTDTSSFRTNGAPQGSTPFSPEGAAHSDSPTPAHPLDKDKSQIQGNQFPQLWRT